MGFSFYEMIVIFNYFAVHSEACSHHLLPDTVQFTVFLILKYFFWGGGTPVRSNTSKVSGWAKPTEVRLHKSATLSIDYLSIRRVLCLLKAFDLWVFEIWPFNDYFCFHCLVVFLSDCLRETWRGIRCVMQQYWKYLKLPEVYFSGKWTVKVKSNQGTLFWIIQNRRERKVWRHIEDIDVLWMRTCWQEFTHKGILTGSEKFGWILETSVEVLFIHRSWFVEQHFCFVFSTRQFLPPWFMAVIVKWWKYLRSCR